MKSIIRILRFTGSLWRYYIAIAAMTILLSAMSQAVPILTKAAIDEITKGISGGQPDIALVALFAFLIFLTDFGQTIFSNISGFWGDILSIKLKRLLSSRYYRHMLSLPQRYFDTELTGTIVNRMNRGIQDIGDFIQMFSNNFLQFIFSTVFTLIIVAYYSWPVALLLLLLYPIFIWMTAKTSNKWQLYQKKINKHADIGSGRFNESIGQVKVVKSFMREEDEINFFDGHYVRAIDLVRSQSRYWHRQDNYRRSILALIFFAVFMSIFVEAARGTYSIGTMVLLIQYSMLIRIPIFSISFLVDRTQRAVSNSKDYFEAMSEKPESYHSPSKSNLVVKEGKVEFKNVSFAYDDKKIMVLNSVSFTIKPNTKVALVGESGEGKTTIANILLGFYHAKPGVVEVDGRDITKVSRNSLRANIGAVFQEPALFSGTIEENIAYGKPNAKQLAIKDAARAANADEFIQKLEKGYQTEIGERGLKLSGGQKQRIAIARAILKNAPILILDEATSSLDSKSEAMVQDALEHLMKGRTTIIIAHRLSTIKNVDQIITLKGGEVDEVGSPRKLATSGGIYDQLLNLQHSGLSDQIKKKLLKFEIQGK
jgi:ATP-binding cassette, subfamily B, bacterial